MKFQFYYEKLINSEEYQKFKKEHPKAFPCSGFFTLDYEEDKKNIVNFDYFLPEEKKMYSFKMNGSVEFVNIETFDPRIPEKLSFNYDFDLKNFEEILKKEIKKRKIKGKIQKMLFSLQKFKGTDYFVVTVFLSNLKLIKANIKIEDKEINNFEEKSFLDMIKVIKKSSD